ncbi:hypothetical protein D9M68_138930 [compost metagenome]
MNEKRDLARDIARQLNLNPDHEHIAHQIHDTITLLKDAAHQLKQRREIESEALICDFCQGELTNPWHGSGIVDGKERRHLHACDGCRDRLPDRAAHQAAEPVLEVRHGAMGCVDWIAWPQEFPTGTKLYAVPASPQQVDHSARSLNMVWVSVSERLPAEDELVLAFDGESALIAWQHNSFWFGRTWSDSVLVTHWMPLPAPPVSDSGEGQA